jgi:hypothetical protein
VLLQAKRGTLKIGTGLSCRTPLALWKSQVRSTKSETNPKLEVRMFKTKSCTQADCTAAARQLLFQVMNNGRTLFRAAVSVIWILNLFGISDFEIRIWPRPKAR